MCAQKDIHPLPTSPFTHSTYHFEQKLQHLFESLKPPFFLPLLLELEVQDPLEPLQCPPGVVLFQPLGAVVLVLYFYLLIISRLPTLICVVLRGTLWTVKRS